MHYLKIGLISLFSSFVLVTFSQPQYSLLKQVNLKADHVFTDNLGQVYTVSGSELTKYDELINPLLKNSIKLLGDITSMDFNNSLKPMVFYKNLSQLVFLDNRLAARGDIIRLDALGYNQTVAVASSYNNGIWLFDQVSFELKRLDDRMQETNQTGSLLQLLNLNLNPTQLIEGNKRLYLIDNANGIIVFDLFGTYYSRLNIKGIEKIDVIPNNIIYLKNNVLFTYNTTTLNTHEISIDTSKINSFAAHGNYLYVLTEKALLVFKSALR